MKLEWSTSRDAETTFTRRGQVEFTFLFVRAEDDKNDTEPSLCILWGEVP